MAKEENKNKVDKTEKKDIAYEYKLVNPARDSGYKNKRLIDNDYKKPEKPVKYKTLNVNDLDERLKELFVKQGIIKKVKSNKKS